MKQSIIITSEKYKSQIEKYFVKTLKIKDTFILTTIDEWKDLSIFKDKMIFISSDVQWQEKDGFDLAIELRTIHKLLNPIVFFGFLPKTYFENKTNNLKYDFLYAPGTFYYQLPIVDVKEFRVFIEKVENISESARIDVTMMLCNLKGRIYDKLNHDLKPNTSDALSIFNSVKSLLPETVLNLINWDISVEKIISLQTDSNAFDIEKKIFVDKIGSLIDANNENKNTDIDFISNTKFKILIIDDEEDILVNYKMYFKDFFELILTKSSVSAIEILKKDEKNEIYAVIADWRLYDDTKNYWQQKQGYDVLEYAGKTGIRALIGLTSQAEFLVHQIRNIAPYRINIFKKENLKTQEQINLFKDSLKNECENIHEIITNIPISKSWKNKQLKKKIFEESLHDLYKNLRHVSFDNFEREISIECDNVYKEYNYFDDNDIDLTLMPQISTSNIDIRLLKSVLIWRRIYFALRIKGVNDYTFYTYYTKTNVGKDADVLDIQNAVNQRKNNICIQNDDVINNIFLPEEKAWLKKWKLID